MIKYFKSHFHRILICILILNPYRGEQGDQVFMWQTAEQLLLFASVCLSLLSAYLYYRGFMRQFGRKQLMHVEKE